MANPSPTVSVIITCYNLGAFLDEAVQSVLNQTYKDFEIIVIDDGSTDAATQHLFTSYRRPNTRILRTKNQGLPTARNLGISESKGRYICCLDADDILESTFLERTCAALEADQDIVFSSCWLKAFGNAEFSWNPTECEFPHLLAEHTVCTAALTRKRAIVEVGGYDVNMTLGYEDWDLAISLLERGLRGTIIPEYLFRYRIRHGSMSSICNKPNNHAFLMRYLVEKHAETYHRHFIGVLETIEKRTLALEGNLKKNSHKEQGYRTDEITFLNNTFGGVLESRNWRYSRHLRRGFRLIKRMRRRISEPLVPNPKVSVVITCLDHDIELQTAVECIKNQITSEDEIILVDDGSSNPITLLMQEWLEESGIIIIRTNSVGPARARDIGLERCRGSFLFAFHANETIESNYIQKALKLLEQNPVSSFVICGYHDHRTGFNWIPESAELIGVLGCPRLTFPVIRRESYVRVATNVNNIKSTSQTNWDLMISLLEHGLEGELIPEPLVSIRDSDPNKIKDMKNDARDTQKLMVRTIIEKHQESFKIHWKESIFGLENQRQLLQVHQQNDNSSHQDLNSNSTINWGGLRRLEPISRVWGIDRGHPIDRYYIDLFLKRNQRDIYGRVLEVKDSNYTRAYGLNVEKSDIVDIACSNPLATLKCDLSIKESLPEDTYDCFILTQTIHFIYDIGGVIENVHRTLNKGGVVLATLPCVSRIDYESGVHGDFWRFTAASSRKLFEEKFGNENVDINSYGNVLTCSAFLMGISAGELTPRELDHHDPYFPLLICVRALKQ